MMHEIQPTNLRRHGGAIVSAIVFTGALAALLMFTPSYNSGQEPPVAAMAEVSPEPRFLHAPAVDLSLPAVRLDVPFDPTDVWEPPTY